MLGHTGGGHKEATVLGPRVPRRSSGCKEHCVTNWETAQVWRVSCPTILVFKASVPAVYLLCSGQGQFGSSSGGLVPRVIETV